MKNETIYETAKFYFDKTRAVHIKLKSGKFYNGIILEVSADFILLEDEKLGELPVFFLEIITIEPRLPKEVTQ